jgi:antitoxin ParD1/3/4
MRSSKIKVVLSEEKSMQVSLPQDVENFVQRQLNDGRYQDATEVIVAAIALLQRQEDIYHGRLSELQADARIGLAASERGEVVDGTVALTQIRSNLRSRYDSTH